MTQPNIIAIPWYDIAVAELGTKEVEGSQHNPRIVEYHAVTTLHATTDEVPWCSSFVSWCLHKAGYPHTRSAAAKSYLTYGVPVDVYKRGAIAVFSRRGGNHVGFIDHIDGSSIILLGGNQGNQVCYRDYPMTQLLATRFPIETKHGILDGGNSKVGLVERNEQ